MKKFSVFYFIIGGFLLTTSMIAFLYFILLNYRASYMQWIAAAILGGLGAIFINVGDANRLKS